MEYVEINSIGNFETWPPNRLLELRENRPTASLGQNLLFENEYSLVWEVSLSPGERLPFRKIYNDFVWVSLTDGLIITRSGTGEISLVRLNKGDSTFVKLEGAEAIRDLENIGDNNLLVNITEFKSINVNSLKSNIESIL